MGCIDVAVNRTGSSECGNERSSLLNDTNLLTS